MRLNCLFFSVPALLNWHGLTVAAVKQQQKDTSITTKSSSTFNTISTHVSGTENVSVTHRHVSPRFLSPLPKCQTCPNFSKNSPIFPLPLPETRRTEKSWREKKGAEPHDMQRGNSDTYWIDFMCAIRFDIQTSGCERNRSLTQLKASVDQEPSVFAVRWFERGVKEGPIISDGCSMLS